jgi:hypothetical protein
MTLSREQLLAVAKNYWRADKAYDASPENPPEHIRLGELWEQELAGIERWWAFLEELEEALPGFTLGDGTATVNACFRCVAYAGKTHPYPFAVVGCRSILAPVYAVYGVQYEGVGEGPRKASAVFEPLPREMRHPADIIARRLESTFGVVALPRDISETPIPLIVQWKEPPATTLFHALFASQPERIP